MKALLLISISSVVLATTAWGGTINYDTTGSTLSCNGVGGCVQNTTTMVTIGGLAFTYNTGSGSGVVTPSIINLGNIVSTGTGTNVNVTGLLLTINVNSTPPGAGGTLPNGAISGSISTTNSGATILFSPNNTTTVFGTLPGVIIAGSGGQAFTYQIINTTLGLQAPTVGNPVGQTSIQGAVTDTSTMTAPPTISKSFTPSAIQVGGTSTLMFTIMNPNSSGTLTGIGFSDPLPAGVTGTAATGPTCGGTFTATSTSIVLTAGTLAFGASCNFSVTVTGSTAGTKPNTTSAVTSNEGGNGNMATDTLTVSAPPTISKSFTPSEIQVGGTSTLMFTIMNPNASGTLTGIGFSDPLPAGVTGTAATGPACGGTFTATSTSVALTGGMLAFGASCNFSVTVTGSTAGTKPNTTSAVTSNEGGNGNMAMDTLTVSAPPTLAKAFGDSQIEFLFGSTALSFTIANPVGNPAPLTNISFSDTLPAGLIISPLGNGLTGNCAGNGTITAVPASSNVSLSGASLAPGASCSFSVQVNGSQVGVQTNTTSTVTAGPGTLVGPPATAVISIVNTEFLWFFTEGGGSAH